MAKETLECFDKIKVGELTHNAHYVYNEVSHYFGEVGRWSLYATLKRVGHYGNRGLRTEGPHGEPSGNLRATELRLPPKPEEPASGFLIPVAGRAFRKEREKIGAPAKKEKKIGAPLVNFIFTRFDMDNVEMWELDCLRRGQARTGRGQARMGEDPAIASV